MKKRICFLIVLVLSILSLLCGCEDGKKSPDPNRKTEKCTYKGTARVFGAEHQRTSCTVDGDGYEELNPKFDASVISYDGDG